MRVPNISGFAFWWNKGFEKTIQVWSNITGVDTGGGGVLGVPYPFGRPPNFIKRGEKSRACSQMARVLVLYSHAEPPPPPPAPKSLTFW